MPPPGEQTFDPSTVTLVVVAGVARGSARVEAPPLHAARLRVVTVDGVDAESPSPWDAPDADSRPPQFGDPVTVGGRVHYYHPVYAPYPGSPSAAQTAATPAPRRKAPRGPFIAALMLFPPTALVCLYAFTLAALALTVVAEDASAIVTITVAVVAGGVPLAAVVGGLSGARWARPLLALVAAAGVAAVFLMGHLTNGDGFGEVQGRSVFAVVWLVAAGVAALWPSRR